MAHDIERVKEKIVKLLKLAEKSGNEYEAASAMAKARTLMDKYQIDNVESLMEGDRDALFKERRATRAFKNCPVYIQSLSIAVATFNDCIASFRFGDDINFKKNEKRVFTYGKSVMFKGMVDDVDLCVDMFAMCIGAVNRLCNEYLKKIGHEGRYPVGLGNSFKSGCVATIARRLEELKNEISSVRGQRGTWLVETKSNAVHEYFGKPAYGSSKSKSANPASTAAYYSGVEAGNKVELQSKVSEVQGKDQHVAFNPKIN